MSVIGDFIKERRLSKQWSKRTLAEKAGVSHSEVHRIENGERENPSIKMLLAISEALAVPKEEMLRIAGYADDEGSVPLIEKVFPDLKTEKQQRTAQLVIDGLARGSNENADFDFDAFVDHMDMFLDHAKKKKNS